MEKTAFLGNSKDFKEGIGKLNSKEEECPSGRLGNWRWLTPLVQ